MRYYNFKILTNSQRLEEAELKKTLNKTIGESYYSSPLEGVNRYMYRLLKNEMTFIAYREEGLVTCASFSFNEQSMSLDDAYEYIMDLLRDLVRNDSIKTTPACEITLLDYIGNLEECGRRGIIASSKGNIGDIAARWVWRNAHGPSCLSDPESMCFDFKERIIPNGTAKKLGIYEKGFVDELNNIEKHRNDSGDSGNMVHYILATRSVEAACDMTDTLMQSLYDAGRISSRRIEVISEILPCFFKRNNCLEGIIENNFGGSIVIDLSEVFGKDPVEYVMASKYIERVFKTYRNKCLFVFTYNMDNPGFSYQLLPNLKKYAIPLALKEGRGNRKTAVNYMKHLIENSEYAKYAHQAAEFMKNFTGDDFSQTDVLMAYEQFEPWCVNKNILNAYDYDLSEDFMTERDTSGESSYDKLNKLIGLKTVKKQIETILATDIVEKERKKKKGAKYHSPAMHMIFAGNPGSSKTTVARLFAGVAKEKGILKSGAFVMRGGMDLNGLDCVYEIRAAFEAAKGGVLFIDEAYSMTSQTAIAVLIQEMENRRDDVIVILAGYNERMERFMHQNEGLKSRVPHWVDFPDYDTEELTDIFKLMIEERGFTATEEAVERAHYILDKARYIEDFGNGRYVRNLIDQAAQEQSARLMANGKKAEDIKKKDLFVITKDDLSMVSDGLKEKREEGTAQKELDEMIGLTEVKSLIRKAIANYKLNKYFLEKGLSREKPSLHMVFTGNPGTAKTTVARLFAEILKDEKVLPTAKFVEAGRADLIGPAVGTTAPLVKSKFRQAEGGVLFIDEAYSLCDSYKSGYGDEAISTIVQEMENHRDNVIVIFAGYPKPMKDFIERNPGMKSRIAFQLDFDDYTVDELIDITSLMASKKGLTLTDEAMDKLKDSYSKVCGEDDYGNGRYVRKMLEEAEMNLAERVFSNENDGQCEDAFTTLDACDIPESSFVKKEAVRKIGFAS